MGRNWTPAQCAAMDERDRTLLVSAAAGSGKTAVLTERIIRMLTDKEHPADISRMLVVTFTRAAAGELRARISKALSDALTLDPHNKHLSHQLMLLGGASISTIDSFYYDLVKSHFEEAGLPASFRLADENELLSLRREVMNETVDRMYTVNPDFSHISDIFCDIRFESSLCDTLLKIVARLDRYPEGIDILLRSAAEIEKGATSVLDSLHGAVWREEAADLARCGRDLLNATLLRLGEEVEATRLTRKLGALYTELAERCRTLLAALNANDYEGARATLLAPLASRIGGGAMPDCAKGTADLIELCSAYRERWKSEAASLSAFSTQEIEKSAAESASLLRVLHAALDDFRERYTAAKHVREIAEFSDVSRAAYRLLVSSDGTPTPLATEISACYDAVFIDEYQDVDAMQDATFSAISTPTNRFMVGDIKQSIYRFRGAQPAVFADYRRRFPSLDEAGECREATVFMSDCFRCDKSVIDFTNAVSGDLFSSCAESIGYTHEDDLRFSKTQNAGDAKCRVVLIDRAKSKEEREAHAEARYIAAEIKRLTTTERKADGTPIRYGDIAVLLRSTTLCAPLSECLGALGIPVNDTSRQSFFENPDVLCVYSLLAALDNPRRDVYLAAALRSPFFGFSLEDLVRLRTGADAALSLYDAVISYKETDALGERVRDFSARFHTWREKAVSLPVDRLLRYLYAETAVLSFAGRESDGESTGTARRANLQRLYEYARTFESGGFKGLYQFIRYVDSVMENDVEMPAPEGEENAVSLITIHHSKGLEYPVCFVSGTASRMNTDDIRPALLDDEYLGCALRLSNAGPFSRANTFFREAIARTLARQNREEEMRVLYVAMTRARERLYVTASPQHGVTGPLERARLAASRDEGAFVTADGPAYIDWILTALLRRDHSEFAEVEVLPESAIKEILTGAHPTEETPAPTGALTKLLRERFSYRYPYAHLTRLPAKLSVSKLSPGVLDVYDSDAVAPDTVRAADAEQLLHSFERVPRFGKRENEQLAAARGTATHEFLQFCRFDTVEKHGVREELAYLIEKCYLPPETAELVREDELERFFQSDFYRSLRTARELHRETRFHIFLPAAAFTKDESFAAALEEEMLTVQGVIDLFYYDAKDQLVLCDYKTDRLTAAELRSPALAAAKLSERHGEQLSYYAKALESICGRAPDKILIYSLPLGEALEVSL